MLGNSILAGAVAAILTAGVAQGALTINASNIVGGTYTYSLPYATFETQFNADAYDRNFMDPYKSSSSLQKYVRRATSTFTGTASFTYKFDFTNVGPGYEITGIQTMEVLDTHTSTNGNPAGTGISVLYSTDGTNFTRKYGLEPATDGYNFIDSTYNPAGNPDNFYPGAAAFSYGPSELNRSKVFYYRVEYDVPAGSSAASNQGFLAWGRRGDAALNPMFQATFDLQAVPEPTTLAILGVIGGKLMMRKRREA